MPRSRSDHAGFFRDRVDLMFDQFELGLQGRDFPRELGVLGDELLEEGDDGLVGMFVVHWDDEWLRAAIPRDDGTPASEGAYSPRGGEGKGPCGRSLKRECSLGSGIPESAWAVYSQS